MNYRDAILKTIEHEGGAKITDNPLDAGGLTKYGISQRSYPTIDIRNLTLENAISIYKRDYWDRVGGDLIKSYAIAFALFDQAVNRGVTTSVKQAQRILGVTADGVMGANTIRAINSFQERSFLDRYLLDSIDAYKKIVEKNPTQAVFLNGWLNRISSLEKYVTENAGVASIGIGLILVVATVFFLILNSSSKTSGGKYA